jgi:hypothetical protein
MVLYVNLKLDLGYLNFFTNLTEERRVKVQK